MKIRRYQLWATRLGKSEPSVRQASRRGSELGCRLRDEIELTP